MLSFKGRRCQTPKRYDVALRIKNKDHLSRIPASIDRISSQLQKDEVLKDLLVCGEVKGNTLHLRAHEPGRLPEIKQHIPKIRNLFNVDFELVEPYYLFHAYELKGYIDYRKDPKDDPKEPGQANTVNARLSQDEAKNVELNKALNDKLSKANNNMHVVQFYPKFSKWYLKLDSLADVERLVERPTFVIPGRNMAPTAVRPVSVDVKPIHCYKCSAAGHYQDKCKSKRQVCGKCGGEHKTAGCKLKDTKDFRCPNCSGEEGRGHANWFQSCPNLKSKAEWKRASVAARSQPEWVTTPKHPNLSEQSATQCVPAARGKRRSTSSPADRDSKKTRLTQTGGSKGSKSTSAKSKPMCLDEYFSTGQPGSSQPLVAASSS